METTYILWAYNTESVYAYGTETEVERYCAYLNTDRLINLYDVMETALTPFQLQNTINLAEELYELSVVNN